MNINTMEDNKKLKYSYIVFASLDIVYNEFMHIMYHDLQYHDNVRFIDTPFKVHKGSLLLKTIHRYHYHDVFNKVFELPLKSLWNRYYYNEACNNPENLCFVFFETALTKYHEVFFKYLKEKYHGSKFVVYFDDLVSTFANTWSFNHSLADKYFDLKLSYDKGDCDKYGYLYYPTSYSVVNIKDRGDIEKSKLFFCGAAKQRYDQIINAFGKCCEAGIKNDFVIARYDGNNKQEGIKYIPYMLPYSEYLEHMIKSDCLLDVIQEGSKGFTVRVWEALVYGKRLLTNNKEILNAPFYDENQFCFFESIGNREIDFMTRNTELKPRYREELSPFRMIEYIDKQL